MHDLHFQLFYVKCCFVLFVNVCSTSPSSQQFHAPDILVIHAKEAGLEPVVVVMLVMVVMVVSVVVVG